jgi:hypothetical protein
MRARLGQRPGSPLGGCPNLLQRRRSRRRRWFWSLRTRASAGCASPNVVLGTEPRKVAASHCLPSRLINGSHQQRGELISDQGVGLRGFCGTLCSDGQGRCAEIGCDVPTLGCQGLLPDFCAVGLRRSPETIMRLRGRGR